MEPGWKNQSSSEIEKLRKDIHGGRNISEIPEMLIEMLTIIEDMNKQIINLRLKAKDY